MRAGTRLKTEKEVKSGPRLGEDIMSDDVSGVVA